MLICSRSLFYFIICDHFCDWSWTRAQRDGSKVTFSKFGFRESLFHCLLPNSSILCLKYSPPKVRIVQAKHRILLTPQNNPSRPFSEERHNKHSQAFLNPLKEVWKLESSFAPLNPVVAHSYRGKMAAANEWCEKTVVSMSRRANLLRGSNESRRQTTLTGNSLKNPANRSSPTVEISDDDGDDDVKVATQLRGSVLKISGFFPTLYRSLCTLAYALIDIWRKESSVLVCALLEGHYRESPKKCSVHF